MVKIKEFKTNNYTTSTDWVIDAANEFLAILPDSHVIDVKVSDGIVVVVYKEYTGSNVLFMETTDALIDELKRRGMFVDYWDRVDIETSVDLFNEKSQSKVTDEEIPKIMEWMYDNLNAEVGVNWDFIDMCIHDYVCDRDKPIDDYMHG
jgi:hypothetical protein